jgi:hypothetical protein
MKTPTYLFSTRVWSRARRQSLAARHGRRLELPTPEAGKRISSRILVFFQPASAVKFDDPLPGPEKQTRSASGCVLRERVASNQGCRSPVIARSVCTRCRDPKRSLAEDCVWTIKRTLTGLAKNQVNTCIRNSVCQVRVPFAIAATTRSSLWL